MWRDKVTSASSHIFPGLDKYEIIFEENIVKIGYHPLSNLPLQTSLYFNLIYLPFWFLVNVIMILEKFWNLSNLYQFILLLSFGAAVIIECIRLLLGYKGNLKEKIPELAAFWLMSILLQFPLQMFILLSTGLKPSFLESIIQSIMCLFLVFEVVMGFVALKYSAKNSILTFHLSKFQNGSKEKSL